MKMPSVARCVVVAILIAPAGCGVLPTSESVRLFRLPQATPSVSTEKTTLPMSLKVRTPQASGMLSSARIVVIPEGNEIQSYRGARWSEPAPGLLRDRLIEAFVRDGQFASVSDEASRLPADIELASRLRDFQAEYVDGRPVVRIVLDVRLVRARQRIPDTRRFDVSLPSRDESIENVVEAFGKAAGRLSDDVMQWTTRLARQETSNRPRSDD